MAFWIFWEPELRILARLIEASEAFWRHDSADSRHPLWSKCPQLVFLCFHAKTYRHSRLYIIAWLGWSTSSPHSGQGYLTAMRMRYPTTLSRGTRGATLWHHYQGSIMQGKRPKCMARGTRPRLMPLRGAKLHHYLEDCCYYTAHCQYITCTHPPIVAKPKKQER
jgi:hypothetical protein